MQKKKGMGRGGGGPREGTTHRERDGEDVHGKRNREMRMGERMRERNRQIRRERETEILKQRETDRHTERETET